MSVLKRIPRPLWLAVLVVIGLLVLAACGGGEEEKAATPTGTPAAETATATPAGEVETTPELEALIKFAILKQIPVSELDPILVRAFIRVLEPVSPETQALALKCWKDQTCDTGRGDLVVGIADGFGDNTWRLFTHMEVILQALTYPEVRKIIYTNAHGKLEDAISNFNGLVAQEVDLIVGYFDFGDAMLPAMREATQKGIPVVPYVGGIIGGKAGEDYLTQVSPDLNKVGHEMAQVAIQVTGGQGNVIYLTGTPGNPQGQAWQKGADEEFVNSPGMKVVGKADTQWTQQGAFEAITGLLASQPDIDAILYDYANASRGIVRAYEQAGRELDVVIVTFTEDNGLFGDWERLKPSNPNFEIYYTQGVNWPARVAVTAAIESLQGESIPPVVIYPQPYVQLTTGLYDPSKPDEFAFTTLVPESIIAKMFE